MKLDIQKGAEQVGSVLGKAAEIGKKAVDGTIAGTQSLVVKAQEESQKALLKKYNPVFPEQYRGTDFNLPNLVMIVDDAVRKDIDVCKGAIGWRSNQKGVEVFYLYDEAISFSGLHFVPAAVCDSIYYVDPYDRSRFISLDCYFDKLQEARLAELQHIACSLGAKKYSVEMVETSGEKRAASQKASAKHRNALLNAAASEDHSVTTEKETQRKSLAYAEFVGERQPTPPTLRWFSHDDNVRNLIDVRCSDKSAGGMKVFSLEFKGSDFATISANTAARIDGAMGKISVGSDFKMQSKVTEEHHHKMVFHIEF